MNQVLLAILVGLIAGCCRCILGFFKNSDTEKFEYKKLLKSIVPAAITGGIVGAFTPDLFVAFGLSFTGEVAVHELMKARQNRKFEPE